MELTKDNIKDIYLKAKEKLKYLAIDYKTGNPVNIRTYQMGDIEVRDYKKE